MISYLTYEFFVSEHLIIDCNLKIEIYCAVVKEAKFNYAQWVEIYVTCCSVLACQTVVWKNKLSCINNLFVNNMTLLKQ